MNLFTKGMKIVIAICLICLHSNCQQRDFNLDFHAVDSLHFHWSTSTRLMLKIDSTQLVRGKHPLLIYPREVDESSILSGLLENYPLCLNLHQSFLIPDKYANDTATVRLHIRATGMSELFLLIRGMNLQQELLCVDSTNVSTEDVWQTIQCSLPLQDVKHLTVGIVGISKMKNQFAFLPSKVYLDRMTVDIAGHPIEQICRDQSFSIKHPDWLINSSYDQVLNNSNESILQQIGLQDKRIIALGGTLHGSTTIDNFAFQFMKKSIMYDRCRLVLWEGDMGLSLKMNLYIHGKLPEASIQEIIHDMDGYGMDIHPIKEFLVWLRSYNTTATTKVNMLGIESGYNYSTNALFDYVYTFYQEVDKHLFLTLLQGFSPMKYEQTLGIIVHEEKRLTELMGHHEYHLLVDVLRNIVCLYKDRFTSEDAFHASLNRDLYLYYNVQMFIDKLLNKDEKAIIYAHYEHVQKKDNIRGSFPYMHTLGSMIADKYKDDYAVVALTVGSGDILTKFRADSLSLYNLETPSANSLESVLMESRQDSIYIPTQILDNAIYNMRSIGNTSMWNDNYEKY